MDRLQKHQAQKAFWTVAFGFISKDGNLNKAHIQYLEYRLVDIANRAKRCVLTNENMPTEPSLSQADKHETEGFLREMLLCFPVLGVLVFELPEVPRSKLTFHLNRKGIRAQGYESAEGFVVLKGATAVASSEKSARTNAVRLRSDLVAKGILQPKTGGMLELTQDYEFSSPSTAAGTLVGASINGRDVWMAEDGRTLNEIYAAPSTSA